MEFVQNADDNAYPPGVKPTLEITYADGFLRIDCNEIGFSPKNVESICKIGSSTKAGADKSKGYVGEKGIGFKSVFKVADCVYIVSRHYSFMFDKAAPLGMIAPIWCDTLPLPRRHGWTSFFLRLSDSCSPDSLVNEIENLDPRTLLFLRQLRTVNVVVQNTRGFQRTKQFNRSEEFSEEGARLIEVRHDMGDVRYIILRHTASGLPVEEKRKGMSRSEILLAFPTDNTWKPKLSPQQAFAFLPIRHFGFQVYDSHLSRFGYC